MDNSYEVVEMTLVPLKSRRQTIWSSALFTGVWKRAVYLGERFFTKFDVGTQSIFLNFLEI